MPDLTPSAFKERILHKLQETNRQEELPALAAGIAWEVLDALYPAVEAKRRLDADLLKSDTYYAIPDDALDLIPSLAKAAFAVVSAAPAHALPELVGILSDIASSRLCSMAMRPRYCGSCGRRARPNAVRFPRRT